jgi:TonB-dependent starch-binding outer membrane protein SusC
MRAISAAGLLILVCASTLHAQRDTLGALSDVIDGSSASVQVRSRDGSPGAGSVVALRGAAEPLVSSQPLLIVDGVRVDNGEGHDNVVGFGTAAPARFDDLDPSEIERIEILPGPAAAALYGPGAGNGAILVTTRKAGSRLISGDITVEGGLTTTPQFEQPNAYAWGHNASTGVAQQCLTYQRAAGQCVVDSVTEFNPLLNSATTPFTTGNERRVGAQLSSSVAGEHAFLTGHYTDQLGDLEMPAPDVALDQTSNGVAPPATERRPLAADRADVRGELTSDIGHHADVTVSGGLIGVHQRGTYVSEMLEQAAGGPGYRDSNDGWAVIRPASSFTMVPTERATHAMGSMSAQWRPWNALQLHATAGSDATDQTDMYDLPTTEGPAGPFTFSSQDRQEAAQYTADLGATATLQPVAWFSTASTVGAQYLESHFREVADSSDCLDDTQYGTLCGGSSLDIVPAAERTQSLYVREAIGVMDRLTVTAGGRWNHERFDGRLVQFTAIDPSLGAQWAVLGTRAAPLVAVHAAFGTTNGLPSIREMIDILRPVVFDQCCVSHLAPERQTESEAGVSAALPNGRLSFDATVYERRNAHVLFPIVSPNQGEFDDADGIVRDGGLDVGINAHIVSMRAFDWNASLNAFVNQNKILRMPQDPPELLLGGTALVASLDHPVFGIVGSTYSYTSHDGIVQPQDVTVGAEQYLGPATPTRGTALSSAIELFDKRLLIGALVDYKGGYVLPDWAGFYQGSVGNEPAINVPGASVTQQASAVAAQEGWFPFQRVNAIRWRELSVSAPLFDRQDVRVTFAARNLALWTNYRGPDPDADMTTDNEAQLRLPQPRTWLLSVSAGF